MASHTDSTEPNATPTPATQAGREGLEALLSRPGKALIGLDFDGIHGAEKQQTAR